jgi:hypothetical protein
MHQGLDGGGNEAVVEKEIFLDHEMWVQPLEIAGAVVPDPMAQREVLRARRRADGICLDEPEPVDRPLKRGEREEASRGSEPAQVVKGHERRSFRR